MLSRFRHTSIRFRLLLASTTVQVVLLSLLLANSVRLMNNAASASLDATITQQASILHATATAYGDQGRYQELEDTLGELLVGANDGLVYVRIATADEQILLSAGRPDIKLLPEPTVIERGFFAGVVSNELIHVRHPLLLERNEIGWLQFGVSVSGLTAARRAIAQQGLMIALSEIALTFFLLSTIGYFLTRKLGRLLAGSKAIAEGHLDHRVPARGSDELSEISRHFNIMATTLQRRVAELEDTADRLRISEERHSLALHGANDGLWDWDIPANTAYYSDRFCEILGLSSGGLKPRPEAFLEHVHPDERAEYRERMIEHLKGHSAQFMMEHRVLLPDGSYRWVLTRGVARRQHNDQISRMAGSISDIDIRKRAEEQLIHDAFHDGLTGLPNRALFVEHVKHALAQRRQQGSGEVAVLALNIERFRLVNDSYGHAVGDELLQRVAFHIKSVLAEGDVAARVGGDQFAVLLNKLPSSADALRTAESLITLPPFLIVNSDSILHPRCKIGIAISEHNDDEAASLLRDADNALHKARQSETGAIEFFHTSLHAQAMRTLQLESDLRSALHNNGLEVHYQPIVSLIDHRTVSFEALVRWPHPVHGLLSPAEFIPLAEMLDLIHDLGMDVLHTACADLRRWQDHNPSLAARVSVNLSARQLARPTLATELLAVIDRHGLSHELIRFEVTESLLAHPDGPANRSLRQLRRAGIGILIDDFGTGYSTLSYLHTMPCNQVKLDGSFVRSITADLRLQTIVRRSIELAHDLGMTVVAECIEDENQLNVLRQLGCDYGQGYFFSRPLDRKATLAWLLQEIELAAS